MPLPLGSARRVLAVSVVVGALVVAGTWLARWLTPRAAAAESASALAASAASPEAAERLRALESALEALQRRLERLELAPVPSQREPQQARASSAAMAPSEFEVQTERTPLWYLEQYVRSFAAHPSGSQHYRRRVEDDALELASPIAGWIENRAAPMPLRTNLVEIVSDARFAGNSIAIDALLHVAAAASIEDVSLGNACFDGLSAIGDPATARAIERMLWSLSIQSLRAAALGTLLALDGDPNPALERLLASARSDEDRRLVLAHLQSGNVASAVPVLHVASFQGVGVRTDAAGLAVGMYGLEAQAFVDTWLARETDPGVREILAQGRAEMLLARGYSPQQALGPPDTDLGADRSTAWAYAKTSGVHWIELGFDPRVANALRLHVNHAPGGIARIVLIDEYGVEQVVFDGVDPHTTPGPCTFSFPITSSLIRGARIVLDADRVQDWCEIDAAELLGPSGAGWATSARASSYFGS